MDIGAIRQPSGIEIGLLLLACYLVILVFIFNQMNLIPAFLINIILSGLYGLRLGLTWPQVEKRLADRAGETFISFFILLLIGLSIAAWIAAGVLPALLYYGVAFVLPRFYLGEAFIISFITAVALGSTVGALGTVGIILLSIGVTFNIPQPLAGGAIISGAIAGNILSPLSEMVVLAMAVTRGNLRDHLFHSGRIIIIAVAIAFFLYSLINIFWFQTGFETAIGQIQNEIMVRYTISPLLVLPPIMILVLSITRIPLPLTLFLNMLISVLLGFLLQPGFALQQVLVVISGSSVLTGVEFLDSLLTRGSIDNYTSVAVMMLLASAWGMLLQELGVVEKALGWLLKRNNSPRDLMLTALATAFLIGVITCAVVPGIVIAGTCFREKFIQARLNTANLSRVILEGTLACAPFFPWTNLTFMIQAALGINPLSSAPYYFTGWLVPLVSILAISFCKDQKSWRG
ncbi:Na+/H+ antiporter, NhaC-like [Moorella glycerini]|uniref:Malate-2H(+)/Na(+)-lactate antiporter n=1 Tax=Neomoorella stamsii TaxID=1266720 RepID=A0A9X7P7J5_9FIRM|nr:MULTISPECIES: Na+/H+ antiporter NhaC family protein [Moorella]PRR77568.1 Malate-2H(+)/Na(+)-lactate antiporter [Moorella stamsii]CEP69385.1 Na+/H+ antiporter, NhaC-like [Moorella glycerini]